MKPDDPFQGDRRVYSVTVEREHNGTTIEQEATVLAGTPRQVFDAYSEHGEVVRVDRVVDLLEQEGSP